MFRCDILQSASQQPNPLERAQTSIYTSYSQFSISHLLLAAFPAPDPSSKAHVYYPPHFISRRRGDINRVQIRDYFTYSAKGTTGNQCVCL